MVKMHTDLSEKANALKVIMDWVASIRPKGQDCQMWNKGYSYFDSANSML